MALKTRFCARCGKETASTLGGVCTKCYLANNRITIPRSITLKVCPKCGSVRWRGVWVKADRTTESYFKQLIEQKTKIPKEATLQGIEIVKAGKQGDVKLTVAILGELMVLEKKADLVVDKFACPNCSRQHAEWAAKIQLRGGSGISVDEVLAMASKHKARIIKTEQQRGGVDIYFFARPTANKLAKALSKRFGLSVKKSYEQHGHDFDTGKPKHREIISLRK